MDPTRFILFRSCGCRPIDKFDVVIARVALFAVKFTILLILAFAVLLLEFF